MVKVKNFMEVAVDHQLPEILDRADDICKCDRCVADIKAIILNNLKAKYVATESGEIYAKVSEMSVQFASDITREAVHAMAIVRKKPNH